MRDRITNVGRELMRVLERASLTLDDVEAVDLKYVDGGLYMDEDPDEVDIRYRIDNSELLRKQVVEALCAIDYDGGHGSQELFGTIWLSDGLWITIEEYGGSEIWVLHRRPDMPGTLLDR